MAKLPVGTLIPIGAVGTAKAEHVLSPNTFSNDDGVDLKGAMINRGTLTKTLTSQGDLVSVAKGYYTGGTVNANITNLIGSNVKKGVRIGGVLGTYSETMSNIVSAKSNSEINNGTGTRWMKLDKSLLVGSSIMIVYNSYKERYWDEISVIFVSASNPTKIISQFGVTSHTPSIVDDGDVITLNLPYKGNDDGIINSSGYILLK